MKWLGVATFVLTVALVLGLTAHAQDVSVVVDFDPALGELPEALAVNDEGDAFLSMASGEIKKVTSSGDATTFANLPSPGENGFVTGVAFNASGDLFVGFGSFDAATHGIWRVAPDGTTERFVELDVATLPNDIAFHGNGDMFVSDSFGGQVLRIAPSGEVDVWTNHAALAPAELAPLPFAVGPNGIAFDADESNLYVVTTGTGRLVRIPVGADGSAGTAEVVVEDRDELAGADGVAFDGDGLLYVANFVSDQILAVTQDGEIETIAEGAPLQNPSDVAFANESEVLITSFAVLRALGLQEGTPAPALLRLTIETEAAPTATTVGLPPTGAGPDAGNGLPLPTIVSLIALGTLGLGTGALLAWRRRAT
jgi:sugar lactone lactonase YvrE